MKKQRWTIIAVILVLALLFAGCQKESKPIEAETPLPEDSEMMEDPGIQTNGAMDSYLTSFEVQLQAGGLALQDKAAKDAASIGAVEGYSFNINGGSIEIYLFDAESSDDKSVKNLMTAKESGYISIFGVEINGVTPQANCAVNGNLVLIFPLEDMFGAHPDKEAITDSFMNIS